MSLHTNNFLKLNFDFDIATPTQNQIRFESHAYHALSNCQSAIDEALSELEYIQSRDRETEINYLAGQIVAEGKTLSGVSRVEAAGQDRQREELTKAAKEGKTFLTLTDLGMSRYVLYFMEPGVTRESLLEQAKEKATVKHESKIKRAQDRVTELKDDMKSLKKAVQARQAEIKPLSKLIAEF